MTNYRYVEKYNENSKKYPETLDQIIRSHIYSNRYEGGYHHRSRGIEDQVEELSHIVGGLADLLISKGVLTPQEVLVAIGINSGFRDVIEPVEVKEGD